MAQTLHDLWDAVDDALLASAVTIGISSVEKGEMGKTTPVKPPGCLTFLTPGAHQQVHAGKLVALEVEVNVFCVASAKGSSSEAIDEALTVAVNVLEALGGSTVNDCLLSVGENPIELVDPSSNHAVVSATFTSQLRF